MELIQEFFRTVYNVPELIRLVGLYGMIFIIFAETGLMVGFFLPGDSLLVTAGLFAAQGDLDITTLLVTLTLAAIVGRRDRLLHRPQGRPRALQPAELVLLPQASTCSARGSSTNATAARRLSSPSSCPSPERSRRSSPARRT